jgi:AcrR family transcriptional regulator
MLQKGYEAIIVEDILERADVGRSTFYAHFADKEDVLRSGIEAFRQGLEQHRMTAASDAHWPFAFSLELLRHAGSQKGLYRALAGRQSGTLVLGIFRDFVADLMRDELGSAVRRQPTPPPLELLVQYAAGAYMSMLIWWVETGAKQPAEEIDALFREFVLKGISSRFKARL